MTVNLPADQTESRIERWGRRFVTFMLAGLGMIVGSAVAYTVLSVFASTLAGVMWVVVGAMVNGLLVVVAVLTGRKFLPEIATAVRTLAAGVLLGAAVVAVGLAFG